MRVTFAVAAGLIAVALALAVSSQIFSKRPLLSKGLT
jgi:hypothetical protein